MVYCGKPSRGCQMCRQRRIKCDETKPICNQCTKSRRQCPGYIDEFDLVFRNETEPTARRVQKQHKRGERVSIAKRGSVSSASASNPSSSNSPTELKFESNSPNGSDSSFDVVPSPTSSQSSGGRHHSWGGSATMYFPVQPVEDVAVCHFLSNFILVPRQGSTRGFMDYIIPLLNVPGENQHLRSALNAVALASLNSREGSTGNHVGELAMNEYSRALVALRSSLTTDQKTSDQTLAATLLLGMFENITARRIGMMAWGSHITGAISIALDRGKNQTLSPIGRQLFIAVRTQMIVYTLTSGKKFDKGVEWWLEGAISDPTAAQCQRINIKTAELRSRVNELMAQERTPQNVEVMYELIQMAQTLDQESVLWQDTVPDHWRYTVATWESSVPGGDYSKAEVFPGPVHLYQDFWIASVWNMLRASRLILASVIVRCAAWTRAPANYRTTPEYATASLVAVETISDIIASVPYHLGWHTSRRESLGHQNLGGFACGSEDTPKGLAGYFVSWPLTLVYGQDYTTDAQRAWVRGRFKYIGDGLGIKYAHILGQLKVRLPSMLIEADGLKRNAYPNSHNFEQLVRQARNTLPPTKGYTMNPLQQRESQQKEQRDASQAELVARATGGAGESGTWIAKTILTT